MYSKGRLTLRSFTLLSGRLVSGGGLPPLATDAGYGDRKELRRLAIRGALRPLLGVGAVAGDGAAGEAGSASDIAVRQAAGDQNPLVGFGRSSTPSRSHGTLAGTPPVSRAEDPQWS